MSESPKVLIDVTLSYTNGEMDFFTVPEPDLTCIETPSRYGVDYRLDAQTSVTLNIERDKLNYIRQVKREVIEA